jgi:hypothetical protein
MSLPHWTDIDESNSEENVMSNIFLYISAVVWHNLTPYDIDAAVIV